MKKICFSLFIIAALCLFCLLSCARSDSLFDILSGAVASDETLAQGQIICYGRAYDNSIGFDSLSNCLGLEGYPEFAEKIEDFVLYSTITGDYCEVALIRLYSSDDARDAELFFERRIEAAKRALNTSGIKGHADRAYIHVKGNTVALFMLPEESKTDEKIKKEM